MPDVRGAAPSVDVVVGSEGPDHVVRVDGEVVHVLATVSQAERFAVDEAERAVAERSPFTFVHAGVVAIGDRALVLPGASGSGKTTLVHALLSAGATYYSDEYAVVDDSGTVWPYARPLRIRNEAGEVRRVRAEATGATVGAREVRVGAALFLPYEASAGEVGGFARLGPGEAVLAVLGHSVQATIRPEGVLAALTAALEGAVVVRGVRGEAGELARRLVAAPPWVSG